MAPDDSWNETKARLKPMQRVKAKIIAHMPFGAFAMIPGIPYRALIEITDFKDQGIMTPAEYPSIGETVDAVILGFRDDEEQIWIGVKPSQLRGVRAMTITAGLRIDEEGLQFFGFEDVNRLVSLGATVTSVDPGSALMRKAIEDDESVGLVFGGFTFSVSLVMPSPVDDITARDL